LDLKQQAAAIAVITEGTSKLDKGRQNALVAAAAEASSSNKPQNPRKTPQGWPDLWPFQKPA